MRVDKSMLPLRPLRIFRRILRETGAVSAVEFAIMAPALIAIPVPILDIGLGLYSQMEVKEAAQAGAEYALLHTYDATKIQYAATSATGLSLGSVTTNEYCGCSSGTSVTLGALGSCGTCPSGSAPGSYVTVTVSAIYNPPIAAPPIIQSSYALTSTSTLRVQ